MDSENQTVAFRGAFRDRWVSLVMGITEGTDHMEPWGLYANNELWNTTLKTSDVLYGY